MRIADCGLRIADCGMGGPRRLAVIPRSAIRIPQCRFRNARRMIALRETSAPLRGFFPTMNTKLTLSLALAAAFAIPAFAEDKKPEASAAPGAPKAPRGEAGQRRQMGTPEERAKRLKEELGLNDEQT